MSSSCLHCPDVYYFSNSIVSEVISYLQGTLHHVWVHLHIILRSNVPGLVVSLRWILDHRLVQTLCLCNVYSPTLLIIPNWNHNLYAQSNLVIQTETQSAHKTNLKWYIICTHSGTIFYACHTAMVHIWPVQTKSLRIIVITLNNHTDQNCNSLFHILSLNLNSAVQWDSGP